MANQRLIAFSDPSRRKKYVPISIDAAVRGVTARDRLRTRLVRYHLSSEEYEGIISLLTTAREAAPDLSHIVERIVSMWVCANDDAQSCSLHKCLDAFAHFIDKVIKLVDSLEYLNFKCVLRTIARLVRSASPCPRNAINIEPYKTSAS